MTGALLALRAMPTLLRVGFADLVAYRVQMVIWILSATLPLVALALWNAASAEGPLAGFGQVEFARYFAVTLLVRQLSSAWVVWELNYNIRTGRLSPLLLRPVNPLVYNLATSLGAVPFRLIVLFPLLAALTWWRPDLLFVPEPAALLLFLPSVALAFLLNWLIQAAIGCLAFWFEQSSGFFEAWSAVWMVMAGYLVPLAMMPPVVSRVAELLPFWASLGAPVDLLLGQADPLRTLGVQAAWVLVALAVVTLLWRRGLRRYGAVGA